MSPRGARHQDWRTDWTLVIQYEVILPVEQFGSLWMREDIFNFFFLHLFYYFWSTYYFI